MTGIKIRKATLDDLEKLLEFEQLIIQAERPFEENIKPGHVLYHALKALLNDTQVAIMVAETNNQLIGSGLAKIKQSQQYLKDDYHGYLAFMYVDSEYRGQRIISMVIDKLILWCKSKGMDVICLEVLDQNLSAIKAYQKLGFKKNLVEMRLNLDD